ncbi:MAG: response regulator transcription factor [Phycisphaerales bacterium]
MAEATSTSSSSPILIVEDEPDIAELIRFSLEREGYTSGVIASGRRAFEEIKRRPPRMVILDLMLPDMDGLEICRRLKWDAATRSVPILMVSARSEDSDIVTGLELGADDYVTKPFSQKVLMARVRNILRRAEARHDDVDESDASNRMSFGNGALVIDVDRHEVHANGGVVDLTLTEFEILRCLASRHGFVRTRDQIIAAVHGVNAVLASRTVDVHVTALRRKLGDLGRMIETVRGVGYRLSDNTAAQSDTE